MKYLKKHFLPKVLLSITAVCLAAYMPVNAKAATKASVKVEDVTQGINSNNQYVWDGNKTDFTMNGAVLQKSTGAMGYIKNGIVDTSVSGLFDYPFGTWYVINGWVNTTTKGAAWINNGYYSIADGKRVYTDNNTVIAGASTGNSAVYYYMQNGWYNGGYDGLAENENGIWYVENGQINFNKTSVVDDNIGLVGDNAKVYVEKGKFKAVTGLYNDATTWYYVKDGIVDETYTGLATNENGDFYYAENGKVNFSFTGTVDNENGTWYVENGALNRNFNGSYNNYEFENGKAV